MKNKYGYFLSAVLVCGLSTAVAQNLNSAYFMDGYTYGHQMNPAHGYSYKGYVSFPMLGNTNIGVQGNLHLGDLIMQRNGKTVTYLHPDVSYDEAMDGFSKRNKMVSDVRLNILSVGFSTKKAFHTIDLGVRSFAGFNVPKDFFEMTKALQNKDYDVSDLGVRAMAWVELGYGYSRDLKAVEGLRVGGKAKLLFGGGYANFTGKNLSLKLSGKDKWTATADASLDIAAKGITWGEPKQVKRTDANGTEYYEEQIDFENVDVKNPGLGGVGMAFDLGAEWDMQEMLPGLKVSAALLDLGFIKWADQIHAENVSKTFEFNGFHNVKTFDNQGSGESLGDQADRLGDDIEDLYALRSGESKGKATALGATLNLAAEYKMPFYDKLSVGLLSTTRIQGVYSWNEEKLIATISPIKQIDVAGSVGVGTMGARLGFALNIHPKAFNLFVGTDCNIGKIKMTKQYVPQHSKFNIVAGINFPFGYTDKMKDKYRR